MLLMRRFISIFVLSALLSAALAQTPQTLAFAANSTATEIPTTMY
jgi:hypothetical protein